jgi:hypothetical protein
MGELNMVFVRASLAVFIMAGFFLAACPVLANVAPVMPFLEGGVIAPRTAHETIRLDSEQVTIRLKPDTYTVEAVFHLFNTGATTTEWTGFPKRMRSRGADFRDFIRYECWLNERPIQFKQEEDRSAGREHRTETPSESWLDERQIIEIRYWFVTRVTFPKDEKTTIRVRYEAPYVGWGASYIVGTGSLWKDNISEAVFIIDGTEVGGIAEFSCGFPKTPQEPSLKEGNVVKYELKDFKPHPEEHLVISLPKLIPKRPPVGSFTKERPIVYPSPVGPMPMKVPK